MPHSTGGKDVVIVNKAQVGQVERRMINPVSLGVDLFCNGQRRKTLST